MLSFYRTGLLAIFIAACSTPVDLAPPPASERDPIEGYWRFSDRLTTLRIATCESAADRLCGLLIQFDGAPASRNYETSDFGKWGERKCRSEVLNVASDPDRSGFYIGDIRNQKDGQVYAIELTLRANGILEAHTFLSVSMDETAEMAIGAALGSPPSVIDVGSYLARALAGKELHSEVERWRRISYPHDRCDRPSITTHKGHSE